VLADYDLDPHHLHLLEAACDAWDRMVQARETLREEAHAIGCAASSSTRMGPSRK
jgi:hypothetical protein